MFRILKISLKLRLNHMHLVSSKSKLKQSLSGAVDLQQCILGRHLKYFPELDSLERIL